MKSPAVHRVRPLPPSRNRESGVTIMLVAAAMVAIMGMAALSIDVATLYLANAEAQRSADAAALAAARVLSISGMTGDPSNSAAGTITNPWQQACALATSVATAVASQNTMGGVVLSTSQISVTYPNNTSDPTYCTGTDAEFGVNPMVTVKVQRTDLPTFFARVWPNRTGASVSATATAEAFNSSNSGNVGHTATGKITPVEPRCVKPWIVPNKDPGDGSCVGAGCLSFVDRLDGSITTQGIMVNYTPPGVIGRIFNLVADCKGSGPCANPGNPVPSPLANVGAWTPNLQYVPGQLPASFTAVPVSSSCALSSDLQEAVAGCDQTTLYHCGKDDLGTVDLGQNNVANDSALGGQCLIGATGDGPDMGQDSLDQTSYPYTIKTGSANPLGLSPGSVITTSNSIVSFPIYDSAGPAINGSGTKTVTIIGFLQVFINYVDTTKNIVNVTVLNVAGCGNGTNPTGPAVSGSSPVPVRLITYP